MQIKAIYTALQSSFEIGELVQRSFRDHPGNMGDYIEIRVRRGSSNTEQRIEAKFCKEHKGSLRGYTKQGEIVFVQLGSKTERRNKYPSIFVSTKSGGAIDPCISR